jgi:hypothetical protein
MQLAPVEGLLQAGEIAAPEDLRQGADGKEKARARGDPAGAVRGQRAASDDAVDMEVLGEGLAPGVEHGGDAELAAEVARIPAKAEERGGRGLKQQPIDQVGMALGERVERVR